MPAGSRFSGNKGQEVSEQKASVGSIRPSVFKAHPFGMPLDAQDGESLMYNGFRHVIGSILDNEKITAGGSLCPGDGRCLRENHCRKAFGVRFREAHGLDGPDPGPYIGAGYLWGDPG